jgi:type III pantothenate kinase
MENLIHTLVIDAGNSRTKAAVFRSELLLEDAVIHSPADLLTLTNKYPVEAVMIAEVGVTLPLWKDLIKSFEKVLFLNADTKLPFSNCYKTPATLGVDRIAGVAGAQHFFPKQNCLVIDAGTCITYDFIDAEEKYQGGSITPGLKMRLQAMHEFTGRLPQVNYREELALIGQTTENAMLTGVFQGIIGEINHFVERYSATYGSIQTLICGGDAELFGKHLKSSIFAAPQLVLVGLNKILLFNVQEGL